METNENILPHDNVNLNGNAPALKNTFSVHGNEIEEIISIKPPFFVRWGTLFFLFLLLAIAAISWFIRYPDIVSAPAKLTSINAPKEVIAKTADKLIKLFTKENELVKKGTIIGYIESTASHGEIINLSDNIDSIQSLVNKNNVEELLPYLNAEFKNLGEVQQDYQAFNQTFISFRNYISGGFYLSKRRMLTKDLVLLQRLHANLLQQKGLNTEDLELTQSTFNANQSLKDDKVISDFDFRNEKSKLINKKLTLPQVNSAIINNETQQNEKQKEIMELENTIAQQKNIFSQSLNTLKSQVNEWKKKYLLIAPVDGKIAFTSFLQENLQLQANQIICFVNPGNAEYYAEVNIPQTNFGKIAKGQRVLLKLSAYPYQQFGVVAGRLDFISLIATDSGYIAKVVLPNQLISSYKKELQYRDGLKATAEIITEDLRLSDRVLNQFRSLLKNK